MLAEAENKLLYEYANGWIPVRSEVVYDQIKRENAPAPYYIAAQNIQLLHTDVNNALPQKILKISQEILPDTKPFERFNHDCVTEGKKSQITKT